MWFKIIKQTGICMILALSLALADAIGHPVLDWGCQAVRTQMEKNYTAEDVVVLAKKAVNAPAALSNVMGKAVEKDDPGKPMDPSELGEIAMVYAVADGTVTAVGENHKIGRFLKITHGDRSESVYGNCKTIHVKETDTVKKGQIIATFYHNGKTEFYYSLTNFK